VAFYRSSQFLTQSLLCEVTVAAQQEPSATLIEYQSFHSQGTSQRK